MVTKHFKTNKMFVASKGAQFGFVVSYVLLGILLLSVIVAFLVFSSRGSISINTQGENGKLDAQTIVKNGNDIKNAALRYSLSRSLAGVTMDSAPDTGLYDPALGLMSEVSPPPSSIEAGIPDLGGIVPGVYYVGTIGTPDDYSVFLIGVKKDICKSINNTVNGTDSTVALKSMQSINFNKIPHGCFDVDGVYDYYNFINQKNSGRSGGAGGGNCEKNCY